MNRPFLTANASARGCAASLVSTRPLTTIRSGSPAGAAAGVCAAAGVPAAGQLADRERAGERRAETEKFSACILGHERKSVTHDPSSVLSELPCARVVPHRRRADRHGCVVDPQRDIEQYLAFAAEHKLRIEHVILTHLHADFIAGHLELRDRVGARIYLGAAAKAEYAFTPLGTGDRIELGRVRLQAIETPGHTPESISIEVFDLRSQRDTEPYGVLTGDTLFVGDVGRPDLRAALGWSAADLGALLYDSLRTKLLALPDASLVYPAHGAGSLCGKAISKETVSTIGEQRRSNYALQPMTKEAFVDAGDRGSARRARLLHLRRGAEQQGTPHPGRGAGTRGEPADARSAAGAARCRRADPGHARPAEFAAAHLDGSINVGLGGQYATWAGSILNHEHPIVMIADPGREHEAAMRLGRIGFDHIVGYLKDGLRSLEARPDLTASTERVSPPLAAERLARRRPRWPLT